MSTSKPARRTSGEALVITKHTDSLHAHAEIVDRWVYLTNVRRRYGQGDSAWFDPRGDRVTTLAQVVEIRWLG